MPCLQSSPVVKYSEFLGIGYFGDSKQHVIAPIFDLRHNAERAWKNVMTEPVMHAVFVEHPAKYEFIAYPVQLKPDQINYALYRSFSSLTSLHKFKSTYGGRTFIKFGWHDLTKPQKFDVLPQYAAIDSVEFVPADQVKPDSIVYQIKTS